MTSRPQHTPTPWKVVKSTTPGEFVTDYKIKSSDDSVIGKTGPCAPEANAAFIVHAVNNHHHLERIIELWDSGGNIAGAIHNAKLDLDKAKGKT